MTARLDARLQAVKNEGRAALITFSMAFDPDRDTALEVLKVLPAAGADILELGIPFSDPMADGPIIQAAGLRALQAGATLKGVLETVMEFRKTDRQTPVILMGYFNPIFRYGADAFVQDAIQAGVDGAIIVDLPPEELAELQPAADRCGFSLIRLLTPTTDDARLAMLMQGGRGFAYYVAVAGITGQRSADLEALEARAKHVKRQITLPLAIGFGIKTAEQAAKIGTYADAVVVGSALVSAIAACDKQHAAAQASAFVKTLAEGIKISAKHRETA